MPPVQVAQPRSQDGRRFLMMRGVQRCVQLVRKSGEAKRPTPSLLSAMLCAFDEIEKKKISKIFKFIGFFNLCLTLRNSGGVAIAGFYGN